jgi:Cellulose biosynthesis protein BcsS
MRSARRVRAAVVAAAAFIVCCVGAMSWPAHAGDDDDPAHFILFSGRDLWRNGVFASGGLLWAPNGFDTGGFMLKTLLSAGAYRYNSGALGNLTVYGGELKGQVLPGWGFKRGHFELKLFAGLDLEGHRLWPDDPSNDLRGTSVGLALAAELWNEPTANTMLAADASFSTVGSNYAGRIAFGWRAFDQFYAGPETQVYGGDGYRQFRVGVHITSLKTGTREWSAAAGWAVDTDKRDSPYVRLGFLQRL